MSNLVQRTLSGIVYIAVVILSIVFSAPAAMVVFLAVAVLAVREYHHLVGSGTARTIWAVLTTCCLFMSYATVYSPMQQMYSGEWHSVVWRLLFVLLLATNLLLELFRKAQNPIAEWGHTLVSIFMIAFPLSLTTDILYAGGWHNGRWLLLALFVCLWSNDTGAYCVGSLFGKHKMFPRVSPGKSWEGLIGGFAVSLLAGWVFSLCITAYPWWLWLILAFVVSAAGTFGDLMESLFKRTLGVKDSGNFMPGHGGVLDRFDSVLLAVPAVWLLLQLIG